MRQCRTLAVAALLLAMTMATVRPMEPAAANGAVESDAVELPVFRAEWAIPSVGVAVDALGHVYVADSDTRRVRKLDSHGQLIASWIPTDGYHSIAVDAAGNVYLADSTWIQKFTTDGDFVRRWSGVDRVTDPFQLITDLAVDWAGDEIYAHVLGGHDTVRRYDGDGSFITSWATGGYSQGRVAVDDSGTVFVVGDGGKIKATTPDGVLLHEWASDIVFPTGLATDRDGNVYLTGLGHLLAFSADGALQWDLTATSAATGTSGFSPDGAAVDVSGRVYVVTSDQLKLFSAGHPFTDVPAWVDEAVGWLSSKGYVSGYRDGTYRPDASMTRAEKARLLYRIAGEPDVSGLPPHELADVPTWVQDPVTWLIANGHMDGYPDHTFKPDEPITRAQEARVLYRIAGEPAVLGLPNHGLTDVPAWVQDPVRWLIGYDFMTGFPDHTFGPDRAITRAQEARVLYRVHT